MLKKLLLAALSAGALFSGAAFAPAADATPGQNTFTLDIVGYAPVICRASVNATQVTGGQQSLGQLSQFCNDPNGYQVWVDYSPTLAGSSVLVDGVAVQLTSSGSAEIASSSTASIEQHDLALNAPSGVQGSLSIRVVAL